MKIRKPYTSSPTFYVHIWRIENWISSVNDKSPINPASSAKINIYAWEICFFSRDNSQISVLDFLAAINRLTGNKKIFKIYTFSTLFNLIQCNNSITNHLSLDHFKHIS